MKKDKQKHWEGNTHTKPTVGSVTEDEAEERSRSVFKRKFVNECGQNF